MVLYVFWFISSPVFCSTCFFSRCCTCKLKARFNTNLPLREKRFPINNSWFFCGMDLLRSVYFGRKVKENAWNMKTFLTRDGLYESLSLSLSYISLMNNWHKQTLRVILQLCTSSHVEKRTSTIDAHNFSLLTPKLWHSALNYWNSAAGMHLKALMHAHSGGKATESELHSSSQPLENPSRSLFKQWGEKWIFLQERVGFQTFLKLILKDNPDLM